MTQRQETIEFWDKYHSEETTKDWIVQPDDTLLESLYNLLADSERHDDAVDCCRVLEIGCGSSTLARDFSDKYPQYQVISTDVSEVCIQNNMKRDQKMVESSQGQLQYKILNAIDPTTGNIDGSMPFRENGEIERFDLILDKGCLDTFLFRSQHNDQEKLVTQLLDNVHRWSQPHGKYVILTPRSKLKLVRDYCGFHKVMKSRRDASGALDGRSEGQECVYQYVCFIDPSYRPGIDNPFADSTDERIPIEQLLTQQCGKCTTSLKDFAKGQDLEGKGKSVCLRRWRGHQVHCSGN